MWPFSTIQNLRDEIRGLESKIKEKNEIISSLYDEQKELLDALHLAESDKKAVEEMLEVAEADKKMIKEELEAAEADAASLKSDFDFLKDIEVTPEFLEVERSIRNRDPLIFVHGGAGTGKSTLIQWLRKKELIHVVLAPTGLAALNVKGMTIHRAFGLRPVPVFTKDGKPKGIPKDFLKVLHNLKAKNIETICIDEISMVRSDLLDALNQCLEEEFKKKPFGGFQMLFVGDLFQLPPVVNDGAIRFFRPGSKDYPGDLHGWHSEWFFDSDVLTTYRRKIKKIQLTKVFRQAGEQDFINTLNQLRKYQNCAENASALNALLPIKPEADKNSVIIVGTIKQADEENEKRLRMLQSLSCRYKAMKTGSFLDYKPQNLPVPDDITLKIGEFVIIVTNDGDKRYVNGTTGVITRFAENDIVYVKTEAGEFDVPKRAWVDYAVAWDDFRERFVNVEVGRYTQIPLIPGYAITCHKSQGKTIPNVFVNIQRVFAPGQMYVALSRTRSPKDITMKRMLTDADFYPDSRLSDLIKQGYL